MIQKVYVLLPVHNRIAVTKHFIDCIASQTYPNYHLVLIDDGSTDGTDQMVLSMIKNLTVLKGKGDWWWAGSLQQGINWLEQNGAEGRDIVMFANDDTAFQTDFLQKAVSLLGGLESALLLPYLRDEKTGIPQESGVEADLQKMSFKPASSPDKINCLPTRDIFMRMADLRKIGGFYPWLLPHYWSDYEFTIRAYKKGLRLCTSADIVISLDREQTGHRYSCFEKSGFMDFLNKCFSKRAVSNPVYQTSFIFLTNPLAFIPLNVFKVWRNFLTYTVNKLKHSLKLRMEKYHLTKANWYLHDNLKVIVGSATITQKGWISTNYPVLDLTKVHTFAELFDPGTVSNFLAEHVWEHLSLEDGAIACRNCFMYMKNDGLLRIAVPDGLHPDKDYITHVKPGGTGPGADDHKVLYNYRTLSALLENAGYKVRLLEWFDEHGRFHHEDWSDADGHVRRSTRYDPRNSDNPTAYTSLIIDATKP